MSLMDRPLRLEILKRRQRKLKKKLRRIRREEKMRELLGDQDVPVVSDEIGPGVDGLPVDVWYSERSVLDVVISGPLGRKVDGSKAPGRWFATTYDAYCWAEDKYGADNIKLINEEGTRWAILVKNLRK